MFRGKKNRLFISKITIISLVFIFGVYGCSGAPSSEENSGGVPSFVSDFELTPETMDAFLKFTTGAVALMQGADPNTVPDLPAPTKAIQAQGVPGLSFEDFDALVDKIPFRVNGSVDSVEGDGETTHNIDLTITFCPKPEEETSPEETAAATGTTGDGDGDGDGDHELVCEGDVEPKTIHILGVFIIDDETGRVIDAHLTINDHELVPFAFCNFDGSSLSDLLLESDLVEEFCSPDPV